MSDVIVKLLPSEETVTLDGDKNLLEGLRSVNVYVRSSCGGTGSCGECVVKVREEGEPLGEMNAAEKMFLGNVYHITKERLSCQHGAKHFKVVDLTAHDKKSQEERMLEKNRKLRKS